MWVCRGICLHCTDLCMKNHYQWGHFWAGNTINILNQRNFSNFPSRIFPNSPLLGEGTEWIMLMVNISSYQTQVLTSQHLVLDCHAGARFYCVILSPALSWVAGSPSAFGSDWSACELMIIDAVKSMVGKRSTSFAAQFNYKRTFKTNVSLISFSDLVLPFCLADVFSLCTHLVILKQLYNGAYFLNKSAHLCKLQTWLSAS